MSHILKHTIIRGGAYVFNRRVPKHARESFGKDAVRVSLGTDEATAALLAERLGEKLDKIWASPVVAPVNIAALVKSVTPKALTFNEAVDAYLADKRDGRPPAFATMVRHFVAVLPEAAGNKLIKQYDRHDARAVVELMLSKGLKTATVRRRLNAITAVVEHAYMEADLHRRNPFSRLPIAGEGKDTKKRGTFTTEELGEAYRLAIASRSQVKLLVPLLGETGARLAEIVGLRRCDVCLTSSMIRITPHSARRLKTRGSEREVPIIGYAEEALRSLVDGHSGAQDGLLFQRYEKDGLVKATHASNAVNKWLKSRYHGLTAHCLRHTFRDRLRAIEAPLELIDQLGGWSSVSSIGTSYGSGYSLAHKREWIDRISMPVKEQRMCEHAIAGKELGQ